MESNQSPNGRAALYAVLSRLFTYPLDADVLRLVAGLSLDEPSAGAMAPLNSALAQMKTALADAGDPSALIETLNREATRLFEGPGQPVAPPFGSFYLNGRRLMGPEALAVRQTYLAARLIPEQDGHVPPDHVALELGFMAALGEGVLGADSRTALPASRDFLAGHLLSWLPAWRAHVLGAAPHPFFAGLATFAQAVLEADLAWLNDIIPVFAPEETCALGDAK